LVRGKQIKINPKNIFVKILFICNKKAKNI